LRTPIWEIGDNKDTHVPDSVHKVYATGREKGGCGAVRFLLLQMPLAREREKTGKRFTT